MKRKIFFILVCLISLVITVKAGEPNYDESKVRPYKLEDPLQFASGKRVKTVQDWRKRRQEILDIFQHEMYGMLPAKPENLVIETLEEGETMAGYAHRKQIRMWFRKDKTGPKIDWLVLTPAYIKKPVPVVILLNYYGNHTVLTDPQILVSDGWLRDNKDFFIENHHATEKSRGFLQDINRAAVLPVATILSRGYAVITACYADISPDPISPEEQAKIAYIGIFDLWGERDPSRKDNTTALMAWGWALSRGMDMIEQLPELDSKKVVLTGYSRLGKAALLAGVFDERFPVVVTNQTGGGGIPLAKRDFGENVSTETTRFTHWYCPAYAKYADNEQNMPFDQHLLVACIAPRALLVEGFNKPWFDTKGEFLSVLAASPVWEFLGKQGLPKVEWPEIYETTAIGPTLGYVRRDQEHGLASIDWQWMLDFADKNLR